MSDLISRSALYLELSKEASHCIELGTKAGVSWATALEEATRILQNAPAVDAVPVVRCGECIKPIEDCPFKDNVMLKTDFCSYGAKMKEADAADAKWSKLLGIGV